METFGDADKASQWAEKLASRDKVRSWVVECEKPAEEKPAIALPPKLRLVEPGEE